MTHHPSPARGSQPVAFRAYSQFNPLEKRALAGCRGRLDERAAAFFSGRRFPDKIARALGARRLIKIKELVESFEFFERVRRRIAAPEVVDLCSGHGLTGMLFAIFEPGTERVTLVDKAKPAAHDALFETLCGLAPWMRGKVRYLESSLQRARALLPAGASVVAVHACGLRTDHCIETAIEIGGRVAVMPCCYGAAGQRAPRELKKALGALTAVDVDRTYRLRGAGYEVDWSAIPVEITPMNRIILGEPKGARRY